MPSLVVSCHGGRGAGTSTGTYVVPKGVEIYFYTDDTVNLDGGASWIEDGEAVADGATYLEGLLLTTDPDEDTAKDLKFEVKRGFDTVPNYEASGARAGDPAFTYPTGLYWVGSDPGRGPAMPIHHGNRYRLSEILSLRGVGGIVAPTIYWLCCRYSPRNSNNTKSVNLGEFGLMDKGKSSGLKPSQIVARGRRWR